MTEFNGLPSPETTRHASVPVRQILLADGRLWGLALPTPRYRPGVIPGIDLLGRRTETIRLVARTGYPVTIERLIDRLRTACLGANDSTSEGERFDALIALATALLRRAHDLTLLEAVALLDLDGDGLCRLVDSVLAIVADGSMGLWPEPNPSSTGAGNARPA